MNVNNKVKNNPKFLPKLSAVFITVLIISAVILKQSILKITNYLPECWFYNSTGYLCPACGNTRSVIAFLNGHFFKSIKYNIIPTVAFIIGLTFYIELITVCCKHHIKIFPRNYTFLIVFLLILFTYFVLRNFIPFLTIC